MTFLTRSAEFYKRFDYDDDSNNDSNNGSNDNDNDGCFLPLCLHATVSPIKASLAAIFFA